MITQQQIDRLEKVWTLADDMNQEGRYASDMQDRAAREYDELNTVLGAMMALRSVLSSTSLLPPIEEPVERKKNGYPINTPSPRRQYGELVDAIVDAEHALMRVRDRNGWTGDRDKHAGAALGAVTRNGLAA